MRRAAATAILFAAALAGPACGDDEPAPEAAPELAQRVGKALTERANEIAKRLEGGRRCAAADEARELREIAERQAANGRIPEELRQPLLSGVDAMIGRIDCVERVTETVTVPAEPTITTTTTTAEPEEGQDEGSGGAEPSGSEESSGSSGGPDGSDPSGQAGSQSGGPDGSGPPGQAGSQGGGD
jgi:hypothetical protein